ncbi:MAG: (2Fe-2S)-binding protein [Thermoanaerobaculum sp.]|nr:(2Fe-2S)-binding protein [Thermoanaerobaculum sp.]
MPKFRLTVNGREREVEAAEDTPLLWVLRDHLALTGTKYGCGVAVCGACTVLVDGEAERSCSVTVAQVAGKKILTVEGLGGEHPVQRAFVAEDVPQCGYCQSGQVMQAVALLARYPRPTPAQVAAAMGDILCRCGTYDRIARAIARAAQEVRHGR